MTFSNEEIAAFADGELDPARRELVAAAIAADPALQRKVEQHRALGDTLAAHFAPIAQQAVPDRFAAILAAPDAAESRVVDLAEARRQRSFAVTRGRWGWIAGPALAASLALVLLMPQGEAVPAGYASGDLASALETQLAGVEAADSGTQILLSFREEDGRYCRAFASREADGIACRDRTGWAMIQQFASGSEAAGGDFRQAGAPHAALFAHVQEMAAGPALDGEGEQAGRDAGWMAD